MKKIIPIIVSILFFTILLSGCNDDKEDEIGTHDNFIGTWVTEDGSGSFTEGNSIEFNDDNTYEKFWDYSGATLFSGTWTIKNVIGEYPKLVMTQRQLSYNYTYTFFDGYTKLKLVAEGATSGRMYVKQ
jgi:hypothetical protein